MECWQIHFDCWLKCIYLLVSNVLLNYQVDWLKYAKDVIVLNKRPNLVNTLFGSVTVLHNVLNVEVQTTKKHI